MSILPGHTHSFSTQEWRDNNGIASTINFEIFCIWRERERPDLVHLFSPIFITYFSALLFFFFFRVFICRNAITIAIARFFSGPFRNRHTHTMIDGRRKKRQRENVDLLRCGYVLYGNAFARAFACSEMCSRCNLRCEKSWAERESVHTIAIYFTGCLFDENDFLFGACGIKIRLNLDAVAHRSHIKLLL